MEMKVNKSLLTFRVAWCSWLERWMDCSWLVVGDITLMTLWLLAWLWSPSRLSIEDGECCGLMSPLWGDRNRILWVLFQIIRLAWVKIIEAWL